MGAEYYLFALFIFVLAALLVVLFLWGSKRRKSKNEQAIDEKEKKVMMLYFEVEDMLDSLKEYVEASREKIEGDVKRIETDMQALRLVKDSLPIDDAKMDEEQQATPIEKETDEEPVIEKREDKARIAPELVELGGDISRIAEKMDISKSEVQLMLKMNAYKKINFKQRKQD